MTAQLTPPTGQLPTIQEQFKADYFDPIRTQQIANPNMRSSIEVAFEQAKQQYEEKHGHVFPYGFRAWQKHYYGK